VRDREGRGGEGREREGEGEGRGKNGDRERGGKKDRRGVRQSEWDWRNEEREIERY
jgi:hypothetical protein